MDANTLNLIGRAKHAIPADAAATLLVELDADGAGTDLRAQAERMTEICSRYRLTSDPVIAFDPEQREAIVGRPARPSIPRSIDSIPGRSPSTLSTTWWCRLNESANSSLSGRVLRRTASCRLQFSGISEWERHIIPLLDCERPRRFSEDGAGLSRDHQTGLVVASAARSVGSTGWPGACRIRADDVRPGAVRSVCACEAEL